LLRRREPRSPRGNQVQVRNQDGAQTTFDPVDVIMVSGEQPSTTVVAHALRRRGRLLFPMTTARRGPGAMLLVTRCHNEELPHGFFVGPSSSTFKVHAMR